MASSDHGRKLDVYTETGGKDRCRLNATNGELIASSGVSTTKAVARNGIELVKTNVPIAAVDDQT